MFGAIDYIRDIEGDANDEFSLVAPKAMVVLACRANHVLPLDSVYPNFQDSMGLEIECRRSKAIGFAGKACIHPAQAATINGVFSYSVSEIAWAEKVVEAYKKAVRDGNGALNVNGSMVDLPVYEKATRILSLSSRKN
jgi:citrate lyase subunit beta/citryl-CoA lyase